MKNFRQWLRWPRSWPAKQLALLAVPVVAMSVLAVRQFYVLPARQAIEDFQSKLAGSRSLKYDGALKLKGRDFLSALDSGIEFGGDFARDDNAFKLDSSFGGRWLSKDYTGEALLADGKLHFRLAGGNLPAIRFNQTANVYPITGDWHSATVDTNLYMWACETRPDSEFPTALTIARFYQLLQPKNSWLVGFAQPVAGHRTTHFRGNLQKANLRAALRYLDDALPGSCRLPVLEDAQDLTARYDFWTSDGFDRFKLVLEDRLLGVEATLLVDLHDYNQPADLLSPGPAVDLDQLRRSTVGR